MKANIDDQVFVRTLKQHGTIIGVRPGEKYLVQIGKMRVECAADALDLRQTKLPDANSSKAEFSYSRSQTRATQRDRNTQPSIDLHGMRLDEALRAVEQFIDRALLDGNESAKIVHGIGTGTLLTGVHQLLRRLQDESGVACVKHFALDGSNTGATKVFF